SGQVGPPQYVTIRARRSGSTIAARRAMSRTGRLIAPGMCIAANDSGESTSTSVMLLSRSDRSSSSRETSGTPTTGEDVAVTGPSSHAAPRPLEVDGALRSPVELTSTVTQCILSSGYTDEWTGGSNSRPHGLAGRHDPQPDPPAAGTPRADRVRTVHDRPAPAVHGEPPSQSAGRRRLDRGARR